MNAEITARMILHSITPDGRELMSIETYAPYFLDAEIEKHGMLSSNSSSNRAVPFARMAGQEFYIPSDIRLNQAGMQGFNKLSEEGMKAFDEAIYLLRGHTVNVLSNLDVEWDIHKQHLNRYLTGFSMQKKILTATREAWNGVMLLRDHPDADPNAQIWAEKIQLVLKNSIPTQLSYGEWHLPYIREEDRVLSPLNLLKVSSARCARTSYSEFNSEKPSELPADLSLFKTLVGGEIKHATPLTHQGKATVLMSGLPPEEWEPGVTHMMRDGQYGSGNFTGWIQFRHWYGDIKNDY